jgi:hypothetical protein
MEDKKESLQNFEPSFVPSGNEFDYEYGAELSAIPNNNVNDLYKDMWKPFERQRLEPVIHLSKEEYAEKTKEFFIKNKKGEPYFLKYMKKLENGDFAPEVQYTDENLRKFSKEMEAKRRDKEAEYKRMTEVFDKELEETRNKFVAEITIKEDINESSTESAIVHSDMSTPLLEEHATN